MRKQIKMYTLSLIVPIYKDGHLAQPFCAKMKQLIDSDFFKNLGLSAPQILFISDGFEADASSLVACCDNFTNVGMVVLSRNFGQHVALSCGLDFAKSDYVAFTDVDMEDPLESLGILYTDLIEKKADVATGLRVERRVSFLKKKLSIGFHCLFGKLTGLDIPNNATTMRIMTRNYVDALMTLKEKSRYIPGMEAWIGFKKIYVPTQQQTSSKKTSSYTLRKKISMAYVAILSFSDLPLRWAASLGFIVTTLSFMAGIGLIIAKLSYINFQPGFATSIVLISFLGGFQIFVTGVAGLYVGRILIEVQNRPLYLIKSKYKLRG